METIFPVFSLDRNKIHWEDYIHKLTPVVKMGPIWVKRDDYFAPLGPRGINGSKLRQAIYLFDRYVREGGQGNLVSGASVKSPQLPMCTAVARHWGRTATHVIGATKPESCMRRDMVKMATWFGADFYFAKVGYNPVLQLRVESLLKGEKRGDYHLHYGISIPDNAGLDLLHGFYSVGANQTLNIPPDVDTLLVPTGSGNSTISILFGLKKLGAQTGRRFQVYLFGIGPDKLAWIKKRVGALSIRESLDPSVDPFELHYRNLNEEKYTTYQDDVKFSWEGLQLHPTYEAKVVKYITEKFPHLLTGNSMFWNVGLKPYLENMLYLQDELGPFPDKVRVYKNEFEK